MRVRIPHKAPMYQYFEKNKKEYPRLSVGRSVIADDIKNWYLKVRCPHNIEFVYSEKFIEVIFTSIEDGVTF